MANGVEGPDLYSVLGVGRGASREEIRSAFHDLARRHHPDRHVGALGDTRAEHEAIYRRCADAYRVLTDPTARVLYDKTLTGVPAETMNPSARPTRGPRGRLIVRTARARPFAVKAENAVRQGDWKSAKLNLQVALQHEPEHEGLKARLQEVLLKIEQKSSEP